MSRLSSVPPVRWWRLLLSACAQLVLLTTTMTAARLALGGSRDVAVLCGLLYGALTTAVNVGVELYRRRDRLRPNPYSLDLDQRRAALDAAVRGPVPDDPRGRREALRLARSAGARPGGELPRTQGIVLAVGAVAVAAAGVFASRWWWLCAAVLLLMAAVTFLAHRREQARLALLEEAVRELDAVSTPRSPGVQGASAGSPPPG